MSSHLEGNRHICTRRTVTIVGIVCIVAGALAVGLIFGNVVDVDGQDGNGNRLQSQSETSTATMTSTTIATTTPTVFVHQTEGCEIHDGEQVACRDTVIPAGSVIKPNLTSIYFANVDYASQAVANNLFKDLPNIEYINLDSWGDGPSFFPSFANLSGVEQISVTWSTMPYIPSGLNTQPQLSSL
eukprot:TRINITY_DN10112_c0_g1_i7.p1 TRINITY_DN10112_c0_g1~~TRINITY_DN10112_c0_g1_i7.p1  ORF type:complete len:185 (+),score=41.65 TRINITY_DN10112_c0_g1_i7:272-826(+)